MQPVPDVYIINVVPTGAIGYQALAYDGSDVVVCVLYRYVRGSEGRPHFHFIRLLIPISSSLFFPPRLGYYFVPG